VPTILRLVTRRPEVQYRRPKRPLAERMAAEGLATLEGEEDWREFSRMLYDDPDRLGEKPKVERVGNVIPIRQRSTSFEIEMVRQQEERRGKR
jgi:hypothetical protein